MVLKSTWVPKNNWILKNICAAMVCVTLSAWNGLAAADEYRPGEFLGLDLSQAVLSPKPLGPVTQFAPVPIEDKTDPGSRIAEMRAQPKTAAHIVTPRIKAAQARPERPRGSARIRLARREGRPHSSPLDAQAADRRIQVWPCRSGGICDWQR